MNATIRNIPPCASQEVDPFQKSFVAHLPPSGKQTRVLKISGVANAQLAFLCLSAMDNFYNYKLYTVVSKENDIESYEEFVMFEPMYESIPVPNLDIEFIITFWNDYAHKPTQDLLLHVDRMMKRNIRVVSS